jgi:hypothetical protein
LDVDMEKELADWWIEQVKIAKKPIALALIK